MSLSLFFFSDDQSKIVSYNLIIDGRKYVLIKEPNKKDFSQYIAQNHIDILISFNCCLVEEKYEYKKLKYLSFFIFRSIACRI